MASADAPVVYEVAAPAAVVRINRPRRLNAINAEVQERLLEAFRAAEAAVEVRAIILTGTGRAFSVGADIDELASTPEGAFRQLQSTLAFLGSPERIRKPVIAAVNGFALGGGLELAIASDVVVAAESAAFGTPEPTLGVVPGFAMQRLPRLIGVARAREMLLTARTLTAAEAQAYGLVSRVVPDERLMEAAHGLAAEMARLAPLALELLKTAINRTLLSSDLSFAERANAWLFATRDAAEGMAAFREKRRPQFDAH